MRSTTTTGTGIPTPLAGLAGLACLACCLLPVLLTAGVLGGAGWIALGQWLPTLALALAAVAAGSFWVAARRRRTTGCGTECTCRRHPTAAAYSDPA